MKRWIFRIFVTLILLLLITVAAIEIVLRTSYPKRLVLRQLETTLQLKCTADSVQTGMFGQTTLNNVTMALPLAGESFLKVKTLHAHHTMVPALLIGRDLVIDSLEFDDPQLKVQQDADGRWNIVQIVDLLRRAAGGKQTTEASRPKTLRIPRIVLSNGTVVIHDRASRTTTLDAVNLQGSPQGPLMWQFQASVGDSAAPQLSLNGEIAPGDNWQHRVNITLQPGVQWLTPWLGHSVAEEYVVHARGHAIWRGTVGSNGTSGIVELQDFESGKVSAKGTINLAVQNGGVVTAEPNALQVIGLSALTSGVELQSGKITLENNSVHSQDLIATVASGDIQVNGDYAWQAGSADLSVGWHNVQYPEKSTQSGSLIFTMRTNWPGIMRVDAQLKSSAKLPKVSWDSQVSVSGAGNTFNSLDWTIAADKLHINAGPFNTNLDHLAAKLTNTKETLTLSQLSIPSGQLTKRRMRGTLAGGGVYYWPSDGNYLAGKWSLKVSGNKWPVITTADTTVDFNLDAAGVKTTDGKPLARINDLSITNSKGVRGQVRGAIYYGLPGKPVDLTAMVWYPPFEFQGYANEEALRGGQFTSQAHLTGNLRPTGSQAASLTVTGNLKGSQLWVGQHPVGDVSMALTGDIHGDPSDNYAVHLVTEHLKLFRGDWHLDALYNSINNETIVRAKLAQMSLAEADEFVNPPPKLSGTLSGQWKIVLPHENVAQAIIDGDFAIANMRAPEFFADTVTGELHTTPDKVLINHVKAVRKNGGRIDTDIELKIAAPRHPAVDLKVSKWPVDFPGGSCLVDADTPKPLQVDFPKRTVDGPFSIAVRPTYRHADCGTIRAKGALKGRTVAANEIKGDMFGGTLSGSASYDVDNLVNARANLNWHDVDSVKVESLLPTTQPTTAPSLVRGKVAGSLKIGPRTSPRALAPLAMEMELSSDDLRWRTIRLTQAQINAYYDPGTFETGKRFVFDNSTLHVADGVVQFFVRISRHDVGPIEKPTGHAWSFDSVVDTVHVDLDTVIHAFAPEAAAQPGFVNLHATLIGDPLDRKRWIGDGRLSLRDSDLAGNTVFQALYSLMSVKLGKQPPTGRGTANLHFEGNNLDIRSFYYLNRGIHAQGDGTIINIWRGPDAKLSGEVIGTARPFSGLKIPFAPDVDKILAAVERNITPIRVTGTLGEPKVKSTLFADIGDALKALIVGQVHGDQSPELPSD